MWWQRREMGGAGEEGGVGGARLAEGWVRAGTEGMEVARAVGGGCGGSEGRGGEGGAGHGVAKVGLLRRRDRWRWRRGRRGRRRLLSLARGER